jgi:fumarylacetoacetase
MINANDPSLKSWVEVPINSDFPIQNLPFGIFEYEHHTRVGVAIGDYVLDLAYIHKHGYLNDLRLPNEIFQSNHLNAFFALGKNTVRNAREKISQLLREDDHTLPRDSKSKFLLEQSHVVMKLPVRVPNYTDFYSSEEHATNVGAMFRDPKNALLPNWKHLPVAYHGRASSIVVSGTPIHRPKGQIKNPDETLPHYGPSRKLDFELEIAFITCQENGLGNPITTKNAEEYIIGFALFNDWSARDIQQWEYVPLGPFLGKNFGSTIAPWIVTMDALEPFRVQGPDQFPHVLPYLVCEGPKHFDVMLAVSLITKGGDTSVLSRTNFKYLYWNVNQQLAHHTVNGCNIEVGDVYASGTISGPSPGSYGSLLELTWNGERSMRIAEGVERIFIEDGDTVVFHGHAEHNGVRIGFGTCEGTILPALP